MKSKNEYIGNDNFKKFLQHYDCLVPLEVVKLRFAGAICSPNRELRPTDVISSLWPENKVPRLETQKEAELFFKFFMGLWDEMFAAVMQNKLSLPKLTKKDNYAETCNMRYDMLEQGFVEGFWGGLEHIEVPAYIAEIVDSLSQVALLYKSLAAKVKPDADNKNIFSAIIDCDKTVEKSLAFLLKNYVLPHIDELQRTVTDKEIN